MTTETTLIVFLFIWIGLQMWVNHLFSSRLDKLERAVRELNPGLNL